MPAFDVRYGTTGTFTNKSSIHAYKITIKSISGVLLYDGDIISSSTKTFQIPADISTISNNNNYLLYLTTYEGAVTDFSNFYTSDAKIIKCFHTPDFELTIHGGSTIFYEQTSPVLFTGIEFRMWYGENEDLNEFYVVVYDSNNKVLFPDF